MKLLQRPELFAWSRFDETRNMDFNSWLWVRSEGNVVVDPLPLSDHERSRLEQLGGVRFVVLTNSDHVRDAAAMLAWSGATSYGPAAERETFPLRCDHWLSDGDEPFAGLQVLTLHGSKTPGELAFLLDSTTLITGDLVRAPRGGSLDCLPDVKLTDKAAALTSLERLAALEQVQTVLPGDGWPVFHRASEELRALLGRVRARSSS